MSLLHTLLSIVDTPSKRLGRGPGSGKGKHTVGRGNKGQRARKSGEAPAWFEGGQLPLSKRLPMTRGKGRFNVLFPTAMVSLTDLENMRAETITIDALKLEKVIDARFHRAKIVKNGTITRAVSLEGVTASAGAAEKIINAGGKIVAQTS